MNEHCEQSAVVSWFRIAYPYLRYVFFAIPNGGARLKVTAQLLKAEGLLPGVPDLMLAVPRGGHHGLFIEMKSPGGAVSPNQVTVQQELSSMGYKVAVCYSYFEAKSTIDEYLG